MIWRLFAWITAAPEKTYAHHMVRTDSREQKLDAFIKPIQTVSSVDRLQQATSLADPQPMDTSTKDQEWVESLVFGVFF